jgi:hypothetical protein
MKKYMKIDPKRTFVHSLDMCRSQDLSIAHEFLMEDGQAIHAHQENTFTKTVVRSSK